MKLFKNYLKILGINILSAGVPWLHIGILFGFISIMISSVAITYLFREELS